MAPQPHRLRRGGAGPDVQPLQDRLSPGRDVQVRSPVYDKFLAPSGAQEVTMFIRSFDPSLSEALNLHLSGSGHSLGLAQLTSKERRSLTYFVLF